MKVFLDVNVLIDYVVGRGAANQEALQIMTLARSNKFVVMSTPNAFVVAYYKINKHLKDPRKTREILLKLREFVQCSTTDADLIDKALSTQVPPDFEDVFQQEAAKRAGADLLVTNDKKFLKDATIRASSAKDFLQFLQE
ncbi:MAG: PIN domain-containing protein [Bacteroidota bacterium]